MLEQTIFKDKNGPIEKFSWGSYIINGKEHSKSGGKKKGKGKDIRVISGKVSKWKERDGHCLSKSMMTGEFNENIDSLIIGTGVEGRVDIPQKVIDYIKQNGIKNVLVMKTPEALKKYNEMYNQGKNAALLAHGTC